MSVQRHLNRLGVLLVSTVTLSCNPATTDSPIADAVADTHVPASRFPENSATRLDTETALGLAAMPLSCLDRPHAPGRSSPGYLDDRTVVRRPDYEEHRAFYGCFDWHSAVNSTWALVRILKEIPDIAVAQLIREKLSDHLSENALNGELEFFEASRTFERPYGYAWLMALHEELLSWEDDDARAWAVRLAPITTLFSERMISYLETVDYPSRVGTHGNTAFSLSMMLDFARATGKTDFEETIIRKSRAFYEHDVDCPTDYEPSASDFLSPCLEEAKLMSRVLEADAYRAWLNEFLPPVESDAFQPLTVPAVINEDGDRLEETSLMGAKSHLIGLAFIRAAALNSIAAALPPSDPRVETYQQLARMHGENGFEAMFDADYMGTHWIGTFALRYLVSGSG